MRKKSILSLLWLLFTTIIYAQNIDDIDCDVPDRDSAEFEELPWVGNNDYLESFLDSIGYSSGANRIIGPERVR